ncbi:anthranilate synthase family protein [Streptomyces sp. ICBB 8177]|uniref:anthranilate synthase family protein n=1 Tax=Streptomyces sp. ICBB 8177 TaxID=563922 RepID=UPI000D684071|nr:anthranilate synthase family protein [Streptomyces sp. ICBB 8177]AOC89004.1 2-amino-2-desoxyisochorismic acid (ADIC) synthase [Streptomyces sp. ICBB 8177]PWI41633.1 phenazine-specific anthranilate synthase component I [Streptomyces sp. ICBB 8177]
MTGAPYLPPPGTPYALLHRPGSGGGDRVEVLTGPMRAAEGLERVTLEGDGRERLVLMPYRQIAERGYACPDDGEPLLVMDVAEHTTIPLATLLEDLPGEPPAIGALDFDRDDDAYARTVERIVRDEIGTGEGANFVLARSLRARLDGFGDDAARAVLRRLLTGETGAYWTFLVHTGDRYLIGSTPEQHVRVDGDTVRMNPISGTYRYAEHGPDEDGLLTFLKDPKEADELYMVVDEELKMMAALCHDDVRVSGPALRRMSRVAHTEYVLRGRSRRPLADILRTTMFAPTVTGSPLENACRVIARYEPEGRGYYSGVIALASTDERGERALDSAILIRTADISADGTMRLAAGATVVRDSRPQAETAETSAKAASLLAQFAGARKDDHRPAGRAPAGFAESPAVQRELRERNTGVSSFWLGTHEGRHRDTDAPRSVLIVDGEDAFTAMLGYQLRALGNRVTVVPWREAAQLARADVGIGHDLVLLGPGPGDPTDPCGEKITRLRETARALLARPGLPVAAVCLGHQLVCHLLGLPLERLPRPNQGRRRRISLRGRWYEAGFYNSYTAFTPRDAVEDPVFGRGPVRVAHGTDEEVIGLTGRGLATLQFHPESFLTDDGPGILRGLLADALSTKDDARHRHPTHDGTEDDTHEEEFAHGSR